MIRFNSENEIIVVDKFDISDQVIYDEICNYINNKIKVQLLAIDKIDHNYQSKYTFVGKKEEQLGEGIVISSYKERWQDCLIEII